VPNDATVAARIKAQAAHTILAKLILSRKLAANEEHVLLTLALLSETGKVGFRHLYAADVTVSRLARLTGLHRVTVQRIVTGLARRGILARDPPPVLRIIRERLAVCPALPGRELDWLGEWFEVGGRYGHHPLDWTSIADEDV
jgi:hypothetical protein